MNLEAEASRTPPEDLPRRSKRQRSNVRERVFHPNNQGHQGDKKGHNDCKSQNFRERRTPLSLVKNHRNQTEDDVPDDFEDDPHASKKEG